MTAADLKDPLMIVIRDDGKWTTLVLTKDPLVNAELVTGFDRYYEIVDYIKENGYTIFDSTLSC